MNFQKVEVPHNTPEQVREYVREALAILEEVNPEPALRGLVFRAAYDGISGKAIQLVQAPTVSLDNILANGRR